MEHFEKKIKLYQPLFNPQVMFSVTGLEFSFTQAPESMKSVIQGCWLLTVAFGNLIVVIITGNFFLLFSKFSINLFHSIIPKVPNSLTHKLTSFSCSPA